MSEQISQISIETRAKTLRKTLHRGRGREPRALTLAIARAAELAEAASILRRRFVAGEPVNPELIWRTEAEARRAAAAVEALGAGKPAEPEREEYRPALPSIAELMARSRP